MKTRIAIILKLNDLGIKIKYCYSSFILVCFLNTVCTGQDSIQISLLSCDPGAELYSTFGHSGLRVKNFTTGTDSVFNYGTFDFKEKNFYLKFLRGQLLYHLTVTDLRGFMAEYQYFNRAVYEQILVLNPEEKNLIAKKLSINALPENKSYKYDFFWDNCSTRIRDMIENVLDKNTINYPNIPAKTFRDYLHDYLEYQPWSRFGIDLILGLPCDVPAHSREAMFLPLEMMKIYDSTSRSGNSISSPSQVLLPSYSTQKTHPFCTPLFISICLLVLVCFLILFSRTKVLSNTLFLLTGIAGLILFFLWFISDHVTTKNNLHFIWANPLLLLYPFRKKLFSQRTLKRLSMFYISLILLLLFCYPINIQKMPVACIPIWISLALLVYIENITKWSQKKIQIKVNS